jgi:hypothetical protein
MHGSNDVPSHDSLGNPLEVPEDRMDKHTADGDNTQSFGSLGAAEKAETAANALELNQSDEIATGATAANPIALVAKQDE